MTRLTPNEARLTLVVDLPPHVAQSILDEHFWAELIVPRAILDKDRMPVVEACVSMLVRQLIERLDRLHAPPDDDAPR